MTVQGIEYALEWTLGDRLRKARRTTGMTQRQFAEAIQVSAPRYSQWEADLNGPRDLVNVAKRIQLATGVPASWLLGVDDTGTPGPRGGGKWVARDSNPKPTGIALRVA